MRYQLLFFLVLLSVTHATATATLNSGEPHSEEETIHTHSHTHTDTHTDTCIPHSTLDCANAEIAELNAVKEEKVDVNDTSTQTDSLSHSHTHSHTHLEPIDDMDTSVKDEFVLRNEELTRLVEELTARVHESENALQAARAGAAQATLELAGE
jgi:hypothetical protein